MNITSGKIISAQKVVIYGPEGIGKSTFASKFPEPLFSDTEGSTKQLDIKRFDKPETWETLIAQAEFVRDTKPCKTYVIDTVDWAEQLCVTHICAIHNKKGIEDFGYGSGYVYEREEFAKFLSLLEQITAAGINVVLTAHAQLRKFEQPDEMGAYDRWELKLGKKTSSQISPLIKEWADMVLFANYKIISVQADEKGKKFKAQGGTRIMYTQHHPCWDAKNRFGLAEELPFDYKKIAHIFNEQENTPQLETPRAETPVQQPEAKEPAFNNLPSYIPPKLGELMTKHNVTEDDIKLAVSSRGYYPYDTSIENYEQSFIDGCLIGAWDAMYQIIKTNKENHPFSGN